MEKKWDASHPIRDMGAGLNRVRMCMCVYVDYWIRESVVRDIFYVKGIKL